MPAPAPLPQITTPPRPKPPVKTFENTEYDPSSELSRMVSTIGEQIAGSPPAAQEYNPQELHPFGANPEVLSQNDQNFVRQRMAQLDAGLNKIRKEEKQKNEQQKAAQEERKAVFLRRKKEAQGSGEVQGKKRKSMMQRVMGIVRKDKQGGTGEVGKKPSQ